MCSKANPSSTASRLQEPLEEGQAGIPGTCALACALPPLLCLPCLRAAGCCWGCRRRRWVPGMHRLRPRLFAAHGCRGLDRLANVILWEAVPLAIGLAAPAALYWQEELP